MLRSKHGLSELWKWYGTNCLTLSFIESEHASNYLANLEEQDM